jgi:predicted nucleotidyltransferase
MASLERARLSVMERAAAIEILKRERPTVAARFGVRRLRLFGSVARGDARPDSDVDLLVYFDGPVTLDRYMGVKFQLEDALGTKVDLVTEGGMRERVRLIVEREAVDVA